MSELIEEHANGRTLRWHWLATASTLALTAVVLPGQAAASGRDDDHPAVWIELGGQLERVDGGQDRFSPPFAGKIIDGGFQSLAVAQTPPRYAIGGEAKISIAPEDSNWLFTVGLRYGRSNGKKHTHEQRNVQNRYAVPNIIPTPSGNPSKYLTQTGQIASDSKSQEHESHAILDFQAGKDVGLGLFGHESTSVVSAGVRFAEFASRSADALIARPNIHFNSYVTQALGLGIAFSSSTRYDFHANAQNQRSFRGIGPSLSWDTSSYVAGSEEDGGFTFDWGVNAAVLFGRQKSTGHHQTTAYHYEQRGAGFQNPTYELAYDPKELPHARGRSVVVPNLGGFAGISLHWPNAKISIGYRGDFFFGAMDGGVDTRVTKDRNFYGPFASFAVGF